MTRQSQSHTDTTAQFDTEQNPEDDAATLAETIASQLTTTTDAPTHADSDDIQMAALAAQSHTSDTTPEYNLWQLTRRVATQHDGDETALSLEDIQDLLDAHLQQQ